MLFRDSDGWTMIALFCGNAAGMTLIACVAGAVPRPWALLMVPLAVIALLSLERTKKLDAARLEDARRDRKTLSRANDRPRE